MQEHDFSVAFSVAIRLVLSLAQVWMKAEEG